MKDVVVRLAQESDLPALTRLLRFLFAQETEFEPDAEKQERALREILRNPEYGHILVVEAVGKVMGMVSFLYSVSTAEGARVALLEDMVVDPAVRGSGMGSALLNAALEFAEKQGCRRITLLTDGENEKAIRFYSRQGFIPSKMLPMRLYLRSSP